MNYSNYELDINVDDVSLFDSGWVLGKLLIHEEINKLPSVTISLIPGLMPSDMFPVLTDITISLTVQGYANISFNVGVRFVGFNDEGLVIKGLICKYSDIVDTDSAYLGGSLESAILGLGVRDEVEGLDSIPGEYYKLAETNIECLNKLLYGINEGFVSLIDYKSIRIMDPAKESDIRDHKAPTHIESATRNMSVSDNSYLDFSTNYYVNKSYSGQNAIGINNPLFTSNYIKNLKYRYPLNVTAIFVYEYYFDYRLGDYMSIKEIEKIPYKSALIIGRDILFNKDGSIRSVIQLGGTGE